MVFKILLFAVIICTASAATWMGRVPPKPAEFADKEGCYIEEINDVIPFGATITPIGFCYRIHCSHEIIDYASCGVVSVNVPNCHVTDVDLSKPHPACCPHIKCDTDNNLV